MINTLLSEYKALVENRINELFPEKNVGYYAVIDAARYSLLLGGKRIRPAIVFEFCRLLGGDMSVATDFSVALEMIHTYSLIHDDLPCMDDDDMRRGKPSCHKKYGEDIALLAGDTLLTKAFYILSKADVSPEVSVKAIELLADFAGENGMIGGQVLDLSFEENSPTAEQLTDMCNKKTGALICCSASLGVLASKNVTEQNLANAQLFGQKLGLSFQIIDDILDCTADEKALGKPIGSDRRNGKTTFVTLYGIEQSRALAKKLTNEAMNILDEFDGDTESLKQLTAYLLDRNY